MDLNLLKVVSAIAKTGSVSGAAEYLNVTQPAVSNSLTRLRQLTGDKIFIRKQGAQQATRFGLDLITTSNNALNSIESCLLIQDNFDPLVIKRTFQLSILNGIEAGLMPKVLSHFQKFPKISFRTFHGSPKACFTDVRMGNTDLMIGIGPYKPVDIHAETIFTDELKLIVRKNHPLSTKKKITKEDFLSLEHVIMHAGNELYSPELMLRELGVHRHIAYEVTNPLSLASVTTETDYAAIILKQLSKSMVDVFGLKTFSLPFCIPPVDVFLGYMEIGRKDAAVSWLKNELKTAFK